MKTQTNLMLAGIAGLSFLAAATAVRAEEKPAETLITGDVTHGGFGGPVVGYARLNGDDAVLVGGRGGWLINHRVWIGGGGFGLANRIGAPTGAMPDAADYHLAFGYGGFWTEYIVAPGRLIHGSVGTLIGAGGLSYMRFRAHTDPASSAGDAVFVLEPTAMVELNLARFVRVALYGSYRLVTDVDLPGLDGGDLSGFAAGGMVKLGVF